MGFLSSTSSFTRLRFLEAVPNEVKNNILELLQKFAFVDIDNVAEEKSIGWTSFDDMLDTKFEKTPIDKGEFVCFSLRVDTRRIPPAVLKKHTRLALMREEEIIKAQGKKFISKDRKAEIRITVKLDLLTRTLPIPAEFQTIWDIQNNIIYFASVQQKMVDLFAEEFTKTFDVSIEQVTPYTLAIELFGEEVIDKLDSLNPTQFV